MIEKKPISLYWPCLGVHFYKSSEFRHPHLGVHFPAYFINSCFYFSSLACQLFIVHFVQTTNISREEMSRTTNQLMTNIDTSLAELKKKMEQQKIAEEQERLRKIQVSLFYH